MLPVEQAKFFDLLKEAVGQYGKVPTAAEMESWWLTCKGFTISDIERALMEYSKGGEEGTRLVAPRPIDVRRRLESGSRQDAASCAASGVAGRCAYPGIFGDGTTGNSKWWCPWHRESRIGPDAERFIELSHQVPYATAMAKRVERFHAQSIRAASVVDTAHAIALRHGNRPWQVKAGGGEPTPEKASPQNQDAEEAADA